MEIKNDLLHRVLYATDASAYREMPVGVFYPHNKEELVEIVNYARLHNNFIIPRTAGTSIAGQVVGSGIVTDMSRYMNRILEINAAERWARVEPGVVLDELNREAGKSGLFFGPETSTSNRCCLGGMVGNNSCGSHSLVYGSTRDHLIEAEVILSDGTCTHFRNLSKKEFDAKLNSESKTESAIYNFVDSLLNNSRARSEIKENFPDASLRRRNTGYALDELLATNKSEDEYINLLPLLAGSEGTLAIVSEIKVNLVPLPPKEKALVCAHCASLEDIFRANLIALGHLPRAVEMMDNNILELGRHNISQHRNLFFVNGNPAAILIVELAEENREVLEFKVNAVEADLLQSGYSYYCSKVYGPDISRVWDLRKAGLGLLTSMPGDAKPVSVIEDTAVAPKWLPDYIRDFREMLDRFGLSCVFHAHIGTGELHLRPILNLKKAEDVELFRTVAMETALLVRKYHGSLSGEHGDGRLRGEFIEVMYGSYLYNLMKNLKKTFDPQSVFNTGKIVDTPRMNSCLRYEVGRESPEYKTYFDFSAQGGWLRAIEQCNGSGDCRKGVAFGGTMCPSFRATGEEKDVTRGRANILRELLTRPKSKRVFNQKEILEALDLCLSCKACKSECPSNVDMSRYKAEFMQHHFDSVVLPPLRTFMVANMAAVERFGSFFPKIYNFFATNHFTSSVIKQIVGFTQKRELPRIMDSSVEKFIRNAKMPGKGRKVYLFLDEFTKYNDGATGIAFVKLMIALGYDVVVPEHFESGRAALSKGMIKCARKFARRNVSLLKNVVNSEAPLVGIEPSAILSFRDEYPDLAGDDLKSDALSLAENTFLYDEFIMREVDAGRISSESFTYQSLNIKLHGHCHQKAIVTTEFSRKMLSLPPNYRVEVLPTGCCGMAGSFGYEKEHYDISMKIGEQSLFPAVRSAGEDVVIAAPGFSCRQQIKDGTGKTALHPVEILYRALKSWNIYCKISPL
jgi:FAD/FMN-containing dehydrogenase/Fe-S oxidoreductase